MFLGEIFDYRQIEGKLILWSERIKNTRIENDFIDKAKNV